MLRKQVKYHCRNQQQQQQPNEFACLFIVVLVFVRCVFFGTCTVLNVNIERVLRNWRMRRRER